MKLSVSNIAWPAGMDQEAYTMLRSAGIGAIEVAPSRLWPEWKGASQSAAREAAASLCRSGLRVPSLQAILFGRPDCQLFGTPEERMAMFEHLQFCADLAVGFGATALVFGAPGNRVRRGLPMGDAFEIAAGFFRAVAGYYAVRGVRLCLEANPEQYKCDFVVNSGEAAKLVREVNHEGFGLHLDTACMYLADEDPAGAIQREIELLQHFHVSEPYLGSFSQPLIDHDRVREALNIAGYSGWITLEMRASDDPLAGLRTAVEVLARQYGNHEVH